MNAKTILWAVGAFGAAGLLFLLARNGAAATGGGSVSDTSNDAAQWFGQQQQQSNITQAAVEANWRDLQQGVFATQPDFWA